MIDKENFVFTHKVGNIYLSPPKNHELLSQQEMFKTLCQSGGKWTYKTISCLIMEHPKCISISEDAIKQWVKKECKTPSPENREALYDVIRAFCNDDVDPELWVSALAKAWGRKAGDFVNLLIQNTLTDHRLTHLPALFETDVSLPLATAYVDLRIAHASPIAATHSLLEPQLTLSQKLYKRIEARYAVRRSPRDALDTSPRKSSLILGPPGAGKSSLLRKIALDIANGEWKSAQIPLLVEARVYWRAKKEESSLSILDYAVTEALHGNVLGENPASLLMQQAENEKKSFILLVDGLDEIASDQSAVSSLYGELRQLAHSTPWIATARPAGLMGSLGESYRCEMVELDDESIETLIDNWCVSVNTPSQPLDSLDLKSEIFGSSSTREMARNPFLLTALCFLKGLTPGSSLPASRIAVYEALIERIAFQAQRRLNDKKILSKPVLDCVQAFAFDLYSREDGPIQIFSLDHWGMFASREPNSGSVDFDKHILPARLLSQWGESDPYFHFIHLTLQEHLIARAMLNRPVEEALQRRFSPTWRAVFRFYGALLWQLGRKKEFCELTRTLHEERDINGLSLLTLAEIFADAGIRKTDDWIRDDLREDLYYAAISGNSVGPDALINSLAALDPEWFENAVCEELDEFHKTIEAASLDPKLDTYPGRELIVFGRDDLDSPYEKLARARTGSAKRIIVDTFWGENQNRALMSAYAFASIATPSERALIVQSAADAPMFDGRATRIFAFALASMRTDFLPFLARVVEHFSEKADGPFTEAIQLVADIGGKDAALILETQLKKEVHRLSSEFNAFEVVLEAVVRMEGEGAIEILEKISLIPEVEDWRDTVRAKRFEVNPSDKSMILESLSKESTRHETVSALGGAATHGRLPDNQIVTALRGCFDVESASDITDYAFIEGVRLDAGEAPVLCDQLLDRASFLYHCIQDPNDANDIDYLVTQLQIIFDTLSLAPWDPARTLATKILFDTVCPKSLIGSAIDLVGRIFQGSPDISILERLKVILFDADADGCYRAALAIGRIDLEALFQLRSATYAEDALEEIAADEGLLIFDKFWADAHGTCTEWSRPPKKVLFAYDDELPDIPQIFVQELSRFGFCSDTESPDECVAFMIFTPTEGYALEMAEQARRLSRQNDVYLPLHDIPIDLDEEQANIMAKTFAKSLGSQYDSLNPSPAVHL